MAKYTRSQWAQIVKRVRKSRVTCPEDFKERGMCPVCGRDFDTHLCPHSAVEVREAIELALADK